jgi:hypothetical protein
MVLFFPSSVHATHALAVARISPASWCRAAPAVVTTGACLVRYAPAVSPATIGVSLVVIPACW